MFSFPGIPALMKAGTRAGMASALCSAAPGADQNRRGRREQGDRIGYCGARGGMLPGYAAACQTRQRSLPVSSHAQRIDPCAPTKVGVHAED